MGQKQFVTRPLPRTTTETNVSFRRIFSSSDGKGRFVPNAFQAISAQHIFQLSKSTEQRFERRQHVLDTTKKMHHVGPMERAHERLQSQSTQQE
jgi:hypothetical protein